MAQQTKNYLIAFILVTSLFFLWAFVHNLEPILIPHLKKACQLSDLQSALIDSAVYLGYFLLAIPAGIFIKKQGYKKTIIFGLLLYALGAFLFFPAATIRAYGFFLGALFIIASGCAFLETAANPYVTLLGDEKSATTRLNFSQSFNGLGAFLAPILGGQFILSGIEHSKQEMAAMTPVLREQYLQSEANAVRIPYLVIGGVVLLVALLVALTKMPEGRAAETARPSSFRSVWQHPHLRWGVIAQFFCVGAQVCVTSFFIRFSKFAAGMPEKTAANFLGIALFGFMIGRFTGTLFTRFIHPAKLLAFYSLICAGLLVVSITSKSHLAVWALMAIPFFESIMFPTIFALAIKNLDEDRELGSSLLVMAIAGGALFPLLMGLISDRTGSIQVAYIVPLLCFFVTLYFGWRGHRVKASPITLEETTVAAPMP
jgi:FHS family L-fucose permease-like MFS transporter